MTTTPLPPHVISTDHPNHPSEKWSVTEMVWIDARDKLFHAYATQARADLEAENARLREALSKLTHVLDFEDLLHDDQRKAYAAARAALENTK